jgi:creatinine deaminase
VNSGRCARYPLRKGPPTIDLKDLSKTSPISDEEAMSIAITQANKSASEGGIPIGAALVDDHGIVAIGYNRRVQNGDPIAHGEMDCLRNAGRRKDYKKLTLYTTLTPCMMCAGTIVQFKIPRVVIGGNRTFRGNEEFLRAHGVEVIVFDEPRCIEIMKKFQKEHAVLWKEDIAE